MYNWNEMMSNAIKQTVLSNMFALLEGIFFGVAPIAFVLIAVYITLRIFQRNNPTHLRVYAMFASFGSFVGVFIGSSRDSVMGAVLPALITIVSGYITYLFTRDDSIINKDIIPVCILVLSISASFGAFFGSEIRQQSEISSSSSNKSAEIDQIVKEKIKIPLQTYALCKEKYGERCTISINVNN